MPGKLAKVVLCALPVHEATKNPGQRGAGRGLHKSKKRPDQVNKTSNSQKPIVALAVIKN